MEERELDPFAAIHPDPMNYVVGTPVTRFLAPDPTAADIAQYHQLRKGGKWQAALREFLKWATSSQGARFGGEEDVAKVMIWDDALDSYFRLIGWSNPIARALAAAATFHQKARAWWNAHTHRHPGIVITYQQLVEWVKR